MLTRRLLSQLPTPSPSTFIRTLTTTPTQQRAPALGDIQPNGAGAFDAKQARFREQVREAEKAKKEQDSQWTSATTAASSSSSSTSSSSHYDASSTGSSSSGSDASSSSASGSSGNSEVLGSLGTHSTGRAREEQEAEETSKRKGKLSSLIYGTHEGREMDREIEKSFSQVLARGKYVHSIVFHSVKPDKVDEYVELVGKWYPKMAGLPENHVHLVGSWRTEVGDCDTFGTSPLFHPLSFTYP